MKYLKFLIPMGIFLVLVLFLGAGLKLDPKEVPSPLIGKPAPAFALARLDDPAQTIRRDDLLGQVWMLNVWASWCVACREEHPLLVEFAKSKMLPIYGLNYKDKPLAGQKWLADFMTPEFWFDWRRTGLPNFGANIISASNGTKIPVRYIYGDDEKILNGPNVAKAITTLAPAEDKQWSKMWLLQGSANPW